MTRRDFLQRAAVATMLTTTATALSQASRGQWPIGCFNRPWRQQNFSFDVALAGIKAAGYPIAGLLARTAEEPFVGSEASPEYLARLKRKLEASGLRFNMAAIRTKNDLPLPEQIKDVRKQVDNAKFLNLEFILTFGVDEPRHFENYYKLMADAAAYAQERGLKLVLKPHGGGSGAAEEILRCLAKVRHANFKVWYDAGNIIYYTGKDPVEELKPIAQHVTGFCAKDCAEPKGDVFIQFGKGKVNFRAVFAELKKAGFDGPVMVECCETSHAPSVLAANARKNREFLEKLFASL